MTTLGHVPKGYAKVSVTTSAQTLAQLLTAASALGNVVPAGAALVWIEPESNAVRFRDDGTDPTSSTGWPVLADQAWPYDGDLSAIKLIAAAATTVNLRFEG